MDDQVLGVWVIGHRGLCQKHEVRGKGEQFLCLIVKYAVCNRDKIGVRASGHDWRVYFQPVQRVGGVISTEIGGHFPDKLFDYILGNGIGSRFFSRVLVNRKGAVVRVILVVAKGYHFYIPQGQKDPSNLSRHHEMGFLPAFVFLTSRIVQVKFVVCETQNLRLDVG